MYLYKQTNKQKKHIVSIKKFEKIDPRIIEGRRKMFDEHNKLTEVFHLARDKFQDLDLDKQFSVVVDSSNNS